MDAQTVYALALGVGLGAGILFLIWLVLKLFTSLECTAQNLTHGIASAAITLIGLGLFFGLFIIAGGCNT